MREESSFTLTFERNIIDDGWNSPKEIFEEINFNTNESVTTALRRVYLQNKNHKGDWLTKDVARQYAAKSWVYRVFSGNQYIGKVREIGDELQKFYGVTELEAINILFERNVNDYLNKYYRIRNLIPSLVNPERKCHEVVENENAMAV